MDSVSIFELLELSIFKCKHCKRRCQYPVMIADKNGNYCPSCLEHIQYVNAEENVEINTILQKFLIPCMNCDNGCDMVDKIEDITKHEKICEFRDKICPFYYLNECKDCVLSDIPKHFHEKHSDCIKKSENDTVKLNFKTSDLSSLNKVYLLVVKSENFLLHIKFDDTSKNLLILLYYCGDLEQIKDYECSIQHQNNNIYTDNAIFNVLHERDFNLVVDKEKAIVYDLVTMEKCFETIDTLIKFKEKNTGSFIKNNMLLNSLKCPACKNYMRDEIRQCSTGHSICKECIMEVQNCITCQAPFSGTRNYTLESLMTLVKYPCIYKGCNRYFYTKNITQHENDCSFKDYSCPFREIFHCDWIGQHKEIAPHLIEKHRDNMLQSNYCERKISLNPIPNELFCLITCNKIFRFHLEKDAGLFTWTCKYIGPKNFAKQYAFEIGLISQEKRDNKLIVRNSWNKTSDYELWVELHDYDVEQYITKQNDILLYYKVMKYYQV